nr:hypothetical protein [Nostoc sp. ChiSLP03a]MDZ8209751.1 hypothetical protein [Nostoc sp. ChiSLP03a]
MTIQPKVKATIAKSLKALLDIKCDRLGRHRAIPGLGYATLKLIEARQKKLQNNASE